MSITVGDLVRVDYRWCVCADGLRHIGTQYRVAELFVDETATCSYCKRECATTVVKSNVHADGVFNSYPLFALTKIEPDAGLAPARIADLLEITT